MPLRALVFAILAFVFAAFSPAAAPQQQFRIAGVVVDSVSSAPIERAEVTIAPVGNLGDASTTWSAPNGQFLFAGLPHGKYRLTATRVGYTQQGLDQHEGFMTAIAVGPKLDSEHIHFRLFRESVIAGTVLDEYGEPVRSADMFLFRRGFSGGAHTTDLAGRATSDDLGVYRFPHLAPGTYFVVAYAKPWYGTGSQATDRVRANDVVFLRPLRSTDINDNDDDAAVDSAEVLPAPPPAPNPLRDVVYPVAFYSNAGSLDSATPLTLGPGVAVTADFSLHPVPALHLLVKAPVPLAGDTSRTTTAGGDHVTINLPLTASLQLAGTELEQLPVQPSPQMPGYFEVSNVAPGEILFRSAETGTGGSSFQATLQRVTSENHVDLSSSAAVSVSGAVNPIPFATIGGGDGVSRGQGFLSLTSVDGRATTQMSQINAKGEFSMALPAGKYIVDIVPPAFAHVASLQATGAVVSANSITLYPGTSVKLNVRALQADATVSGTALKNGRPCAGAMIVLVPEDATQTAALFHRDQSDSDGTFTLSPIFPGRYTLLAIENGWDLEWSKLSVLFPYLAAGVPLEVKPGANVSINVRVQ